MTPVKTFVMLLVVRLGSVCLIQTSYVPDEYWQSLEIAHHMTFGYGYITWEWKEGIRSFLYPSLFALLFKVLELTNLDSVHNLTLIPRLLQAVISTVSDFCLWLWLSQEETYGNVSLFTICTSWFWFYCCSRTLSNTLETSLTAIALYLYPWRREQSNKSASFLWFVGLACITRPTAAVVWIPLCLYHILMNSILNVLWQKYLPIGIICIIISLLVDSYFYKRLVFSSLNFVYFNVIKNVGEFYGAHPSHWYITSGLPVVLGAHLIPFSAGCMKFIFLPVFQSKRHKFSSHQHKKTVILLAVSIIWTVTVYSFLPHKEFRFILPLIPMVLFISTMWLTHLHRTAHRYIIVIMNIALLFGAVFPSLYLGMVHQRGTLAVMQELAEDAARAPFQTDLLFLMPCHSTPMYSHLHVNVSSKFLTCDPFYEGEKDEADLFYEGPEQWLVTYFRKVHAIPSHIIMFDNLYPQLDQFLSHTNYTVFSCIFHSQMTEGRVGHYLYVLKHIDWAYS